MSCDVCLFGCLVGCECDLRILCPNGYRYGHSYYGMRIENRTKASEWYHFNDHEWNLIHISRSRHWHWISQKRYEIEIQLRRNTSRDLHMSYTQGCHYEWPWLILIDLAKYSMTRSIAQPLCDSWASDKSDVHAYHQQCNILYKETTCTTSTIIPGTQTSQIMARAPIF